MTKFQTAEWWAEEFSRMLEQQRPEDLHLDYKDKRSLSPTSRGGDGIDNRKRAEDLSKDVSSFLNSDGGVLVYGVPESDSIDGTGGTPIPGGPDIGFNRGDIDKEIIENLITSNIQPRPGPDLFQVSEVPYANRKLVFLVEVAIGFGDIWQAKDKRYYKRFQYKAEPMEHYEINMVRERHQGPDLKLVFGINDRWEPSLSNLESLSSHGEELVVHVGICNAADNIAEPALIEIVLWPSTNGEAMNHIHTDRFPDGVFLRSTTSCGLICVSLRSCLPKTTLGGGMCRTAPLPSFLSQPLSSFQGPRHDASGTQAAVSTGVGRAFAVPVLLILHHQDHHKGEGDLTIPIPPPSRKVSCQHSRQ